MKGPYAGDGGMITETPNDHLYTLSEGERARLLDWARSVIGAALRADSPPTPEGIDRQLVAGCFVTLRRVDNGALRGCRGMLFQADPLPSAVAYAARAAALDDPRFPPVTEHEMDALAIEISLLSEPMPIDPTSIEVGRHGLMIRAADRVGVLLPGVATDYGWDVLTYLDAVCAKAALPAGAWRTAGVELLGFESTSWHEPNWPDRPLGALGAGKASSQKPSAG